MPSYIMLESMSSNQKMGIGRITEAKGQDSIRDNLGQVLVIFEPWRFWGEKKA
jgi:hypothetical protein